MSESVDVVVIGMGPGGEEVAERLAEAGLSVVRALQRIRRRTRKQWIPSCAGSLLR